MGWWELSVNKKDMEGEEITEIRKLSNDDIGHIIEMIRQRYSDGDLIDGEGYYLKKGD